MKEENIFNNKNITANSEQISTLKKHFPNCFDKEGNFLIESFKEILKSDDINTSHEGYKLDWLGKSYARLLANERPRTLICPDKEHNAKKQNKNSNNLLIKGDNLEVLKHLKNAYTESVKVIYIDPPYNTGSDGFVYKDDRKFTKEELANLANVSEEDAQRILDFTDKGSNSHSAWLTFIYPRLYVARELLQEDGVIFISIDDNEQAQLKLLCDEVFGEENFVAELIWKKKAGGANDSTDIAVEHEYILCFKKQKNGINKIPLDEARVKDYKYSDEKEQINGKYLIKNLNDKSLQDSKGLHYDIKCPDGTILKGVDNQWKCNESTFLERLNDNRIVFEQKSSGEWTCKYKIYINEEKGQLKFDENGNVVKKGRNLNSLIDNMLNKDGSKEIKHLFNSYPFSYPKPTKLIKQLMQCSARDNSIVLDFFAGSGTTAHAVMDLNAEDDGNRQYIMVQLPEKTDKKSEANKAGYKTIFDITKARIEKAAEKIQTEKPDYKGDLGFKIFETTPLPNYYNEEIDELSLDTQTKIWDGSDADENLLEAILTTWMLYDRILLTTDLELILLNDYKAYYGKGKESNTLYLMYKGFTINHINLILDKLENDKEFVPKKIVLYGHNFDTKPQRELSEALKSLHNKKQLEIDIIKRY